MNRNPLILDIKGNSLDDGPGIRSVVFFKGCPLSCVWCHNPESKSRQAEISFDRDSCIACNTCRESCRRDALSAENPFYVDRTRCDLCFDCLEGCPSKALDKFGDELSLNDILPVLLRDKPFFDNSGGGVTLSGGEPTLFMDFISVLLQALKEHGIHTLIETSGLFSFESFREKVIPFTDLVYIDVKLLDDRQHQRYCGVSNSRILKNIIQLNDLSKEEHVDWLPRIPLIPGITDSDDNLSGIAAFLSENDNQTIQLLNYNPFWPDKARKIGASDHFIEESAGKKRLNQNELERRKQPFLNLGIEII